MPTKPPNASHVFEPSTYYKTNAILNAPNTTLPMEQNVLAVYCRALLAPLKYYVRHVRGLCIYIGRDVWLNVPMSMVKSLMGSVLNVIAGVSHAKAQVLVFSALQVTFSTLTNA